MGLRVVLASLLALAAASPAVEAQYFRAGPFGGAFRRAPDPGSGRDAPNAYRAYADPDRPDAAAGIGSATGTFRTLCVRLCDGFYFPISFAVPENGIARDAEQCLASCGVEARLFYHLNPGGSVDTMMDLAGRPYSALATAFKYRKTLVAGCLCRPQASAATAGAIGAEGTPGAAAMPRAPDGLSTKTNPRALAPPAFRYGAPPAEMDPVPALAGPPAGLRAPEGKR